MPTIVSLGIHPGPQGGSGCRRTWFVKRVDAASPVVLAAALAGRRPDRVQRRTQREQRTTDHARASPRSAPRAAGGPRTPSRSRTSAKAAGIELKFSDAQQKQENQIKAIRSYIQQKVDVIAFSPVVESGWDTVLKEAKGAKIPVILTDRAVDSKDTTLYKTFIGSDFVKEGKLGRRVAGRRSTRARPGPVNIVELQGTTGSAPANDRKKGFAEVITADPNLKIIASQTGDFTRAKGKEVMEAFLKANPKIDVLFAHNDDMGLGAIEAIEGAGQARARTSRSSRSTRSRTACRRSADGKINFIAECSPLLGPQLMDLVKKVVRRRDGADADRDRGDHLHPGAGQGRPARPASTELSRRRRGDRPGAGTPPRRGAGATAMTDAAPDPRDDRDRQGVPRRARRSTASTSGCSPARCTR